MKICSKCLIPKSNEEFHRNKTHKDGLQSECKHCVKQHNQVWHTDNGIKIRRIRKNRRDVIADQLTDLKRALKCQVCGEAETVCLDFHHKNPTEKEFEIANALSVGRSFKNILKEIEKCICVCANCHRKIHANIIKI